ncbi:MAG TPA: glycerophosphodiester phosphodiesterase, partial [Labilithrix sp.]|nr:glycerophosphodiester phosphodiesterase [Labilithrix sp.]
LLVVVAGCTTDTSDFLVIGHRGAPNEELENSIAGFARARDLGADGVELDVQITADGRLVVMHDLTLDRTTLCKGSVRERTLADLAGCRLVNGEPVRTLEEVLGIIMPWFSLVFVEIKVDELVAQVERADEGARVLLALGLTEKVVLTSYDETVLGRLAERRAEGVRAAWDDFTNIAISKAARFRLDWVLIRIDGIEGREGTIVKGLDKRLCVYGINTPANFVKASKAGVDVMMTDSVEVLTRLLGRGRGPAASPDGGATEGGP